MTDAAEIAAKLTPAQIRALRNPERVFWDWERLVRLEIKLKVDLLNIVGDDLTDLGRAVLAALDAKEAGNG